MGQEESWHQRLSLILNMKPKQVKKEAAKLQVHRDRACTLFQKLETSDEDFAIEAILAYKGLWEATRSARSSMFNFELPDVEFPSEWKGDLEKVKGPRSRNHKAKNILIGMMKKGYGNLHPEMEATP